MPTAEHKVKQKVKAMLIAYNAWYCAPVGGMLGRSGLPDFLACCNGQFIAIETKAGKGRCTALQKLELQRITEAGGIALVVSENNLAELENLLYAASRKESRGVSREKCPDCQGAGQETGGRT